MPQSYEISLEDFARRLGANAQALGRISFRVPLAVCAYLIQNDTRERFKKGVDPDGNRWKPLKRTPRVPKGRSKDQPLWATGRLVASTAANAPDHVQDVNDTALVYGSSVKYAGYHQDGTRTIPARPFLGVGPALLEQCAGVVAKYVEEELMRALGG